ncbi:pantothenate synthase [Bachmanniomyces sp. S44760]|nr:pantothenate synthase [Bachmanniomyces sp. S44760]
MAGPPQRWLRSWSLGIVEIFQQVPPAGADSATTQDEDSKKIIPELGIGLQMTKAVRPELRSSLEIVRKLRYKLRLNNRTVGLVPTMGALHDGHLSLIRKAAKENDDVFVSIFVNPTQFGTNEDLGSYPRTMTEDMKKINTLAREFSKDESLGNIRCVFNPTRETMYPGLPPSSEPDGLGSFVTVKPLGSILEGASRPVFFRGVATICMKLLNLIQPETVYFGQKDIQQGVLISRMIKDFLIDTRIDLVHTIREDDGLAMSSRNVYLGERRRRIATVLYRSLKAAHDAYEAGETKRTELLNAALGVAIKIQSDQRRLPTSERARFEIDYMSIADPQTMAEVDIVDGARGAIMSGALVMLPLEELQEGEGPGLGEGERQVRLIDNMLLGGKRVINTINHGDLGGA